jgi:hypothetical protein
MQKGMPHRGSVHKSNRSSTTQTDAAKSLDNIEPTDVPLVAVNLVYLTPEQLAKIDFDHRND